MADVYTIVLISVLGVVAAVLVYGFVYLFVKRYRRELKGDIYLMPEDTREKEEQPIEIQAAEERIYERGGYIKPQD